MNDTSQNQQAPTVPVAPVAPVTTAPEDLQKLGDELKNLAAAAAAEPQQPAVAETAPVVTPSIPAPEEKSATTDLKVTLYTTPTCPFSKAEKEFFTKEGAKFEEKDVEGSETNLREMLSISDNFAGVPVTVIEKPTGEKLVVKGFTQADFEEEWKKFVGGKEPTAETAVPTAPSAPKEKAYVTPAVEPVVSAPTEMPATLPSVPTEEKAPQIPDLK